MFKARLARFYGWTDREIGSMSMTKAKEYMNCVTMIEAQEALNLLPVYVYPYMKKGREKEFLKNLYKQSKINLITNKVQSTTADIYQHLIRTLGNG